MASPARPSRFFFISGFLMFLDWDRSLETWKGKLKRRVRSLLVPYLICGAIAIASGLTLAGLVGSDGGGVGEWGAFEFLYYWLLDPHAFHLWFLRELMLFSVGAILWIRLPRPAQWLLLGGLFFGWLTNFDWMPQLNQSENAVRALEGLAYYLLGGTLAQCSHRGAFFGFSKSSPCLSRSPGWLPSQPGH